jgi:prepilin-type N-terminal cleavage/methylation domain-containing protein
MNKTINNKKGFSLTELLIVVLIIGILSALAFPQYRKNVRRTRATEAMMTLKYYTDAANEYFYKYDNYSDISGVAALGEFPQPGGVTFAIAAQNLDDITINAVYGTDCTISFKSEEGSLTEKTCAGALCPALGALPSGTAGTYYFK